MLQAKAKSCFEVTFVLLKDDRAIGQFQNKWFSEALDIQLLGRRNLQLRRASLFGRRFVLVDTANGNELASAEPKNFFGSKWRLDLSCGAAELVPASVFSRQFKILVNGRQGGVVQCRWCSPSWAVVPTFEMPVVDQLAVGLLCQVILRRRRRHNN